MDKKELEELYEGGDDNDFNDSEEEKTKIHNR